MRQYLLGIFILTAIGFFVYRDQGAFAMAPPPATTLCVVYPEVCAGAAAVPDKTEYSDVYQYPNGLGVYATLGERGGFGSVVSSGQNIDATLVLTNPDPSARNYTLQWRMPNGYGYLGVKSGSPSPTCLGALCTWTNIPVPPGESRIELVLQAP